MAEDGIDDELGVVTLTVTGLWIDTALYEVPLLALTSATYFRVMDSDWTHEDQEQNAYMKARKLLEHGCDFGEYGTRRRRDLHTQNLVIQGLVRAQIYGKENGLSGSVLGTSNVYLAMKYGLKPMGTVGHEWFMGFAALIGDYRTSMRISLSYWYHCFGQDFWMVVPTDTFGTFSFLEEFRRPILQVTNSLDVKDGKVIGTASCENCPDPPNLPTLAPDTSFAKVFQGVRHDSGDPVRFVQTMRDFYDSMNITETKRIVFSDSLDVDKCIRYKALAENAGFQPTFGVGTSFANDFNRKSTGAKSTPLNIVMKPRSFNGRAVVKLGDTQGKHSGGSSLIEEVKCNLSYVAMNWAGSDEATRWGHDSE